MRFATGLASVIAFCLIVWAGTSLCIGILSMLPLWRWILVVPIVNWLVAEITLMAACFVSVLIEYRSKKPPRTTEWLLALLLLYVVFFFAMSTKNKMIDGMPWNIYTGIAINFLAWSGAIRRQFIGLLKIRKEMSIP